MGRFLSWLASLRGSTLKKRTVSDSCCPPTKTEPPKAASQCDGEEDASLETVIEILLRDERSIHHRTYQSRRVLLRVDFNVPLNKNQEITDDSRILAPLPTIEHLSKAGAKVILLSHLGRPQPGKMTWEEMKAKYSLAPVAARLKELLGGRFKGITDDCVGDAVEERVEGLENGDVLLVENTRFHKGETKNYPEFGEKLARLGEVFIDDAFGVVHRDQASVTGLVKQMDDCLPGPLVQKELENLTRALDNPVRPLGVIVGGAKVADKIGVLWALIEKADRILIGGKMAFTFLAARGVQVGETQIEKDKLKDALAMEKLAAEKGVQFILPVDVVVGDDLDNPTSTRLVPLTQSCCTKESPCIPDGFYGGDIGPESSANFSKAIEECETIFWNGPMGKFETKEYAEGTWAVAKTVAKVSEQGTVTVAGGGDTAAALKSLNIVDKLTHLSTGGGASLELIEGKGMPGLRVLALCKCHNKNENPT